MAGTVGPAARGGVQVTLLPMTRRGARLLVGLAVSALLLAGCGGDDGDGTAAPATSSPSTSAPGAATSAPGTTSPGAAAPAAEVEFEDQSGDGGSAVVDRVVAPAAGFLVVSLHDTSPGSVLGSAAVPSGVSSAVRVVLQPPLTASAELQATLYADTDGDGSFDAAVDRAVADDEHAPDRDQNRGGEHDGDPDQDEDHDRDPAHAGIVADDAHYRVG